jgi:hypothetical protein
MQNPCIVVLVSRNFFQRLGLGAWGLINWGLGLGAFSNSNSNSVRMIFIINNLLENFFEKKITKL